LIAVEHCPAQISSDAVHWAISRLSYERCQSKKLRAASGVDDGNTHLHGQSSPVSKKRSKPMHGAEAEQTEKKEARRSRLHSGKGIQLSGAGKTALQDAEHHKARQQAAEGRRLQSKGKSKAMTMLGDRSRLQSNRGPRNKGQPGALWQVDASAEADVSGKRSRHMNAEGVHNRGSEFTDSVEQGGRMRRSQQPQNINGVKGKHESQKTAKRRSKKHKPGDVDEIDRMLTKRTRQLFGLSKKGATQGGAMALGTHWLQ
jgi:hypothetical protein